jgi:hypothetical protein
VTPNHGAGIDALIGRLEAITKVRTARGNLHRAQREYDQAIEDYERDRGER